MYPVLRIQNTPELTEAMNRAFEQYKTSHERNCPRPIIAVMSPCYPRHIYDLTADYLEGDIHNDCADWPIEMAIYD